MGLGGENGFSESDLSASIHATGCPPPYSSSVKYRLILATHLAEKISPYGTFGKITEKQCCCTMAKEKNDHISEISTKPCPVLDAAPFKNLSTKAAEKPAKSELERKKKTGTTVVQTIVPVVGREKAYDK